jgi:hypothetical protein
MDTGAATGRVARGRMRRWATGALVAAVALAACGGGATGDGAGGPAVSIKTLQSAAANTQAVSSSRFTVDMAIDVAGQSVSMHSEGVTSGDGKTGSFTTEIPMLGTVEQRVVDGVVYLKFGDTPLGSKLGGKPWVKMSLDQLGDKVGIDLGALGNDGASSPHQGLEYLKSLSGDVQDLGTDTVNGQRATHYRASIDYAKVAEELRDTAADARDEIAKIGVVPADVWIDGQDRVVKMHYAIDAGSLGALGGHDGAIKVTIEISDFGAPVDVQAPPADQVTDFSALSALHI